MNQHESFKYMIINSAVYISGCRVTFFFFFFLFLQGTEIKQPDYYADWFIRYVISSNFILIASNTA